MANPFQRTPVVRWWVWWWGIRWWRVWWGAASPRFLAWISTRLFRTTSFHYNFAPDHSAVTQVLS